MEYKDSLLMPKTEFPMRGNLPKREPEIQEKWEEMNIYKMVQERTKDRPMFVLHDGPPYANGDIHMGHAMNKVLKDFIVRTQTLLGKNAPYIPGWDCHGLPIEWKVEEAYRAKKQNKDDVPVDQFRAEFRASAAK